MPSRAAVVNSRGLSVHGNEILLPISLEILFLCIYKTKPNQTKQKKKSNKMQRKNKTETYIRFWQEFNITAENEPERPLREVKS